VDKTGSILVAGFSDGVVRVVVVSLEEMKNEPRSKEEFITLIQATKPHSKPITAMSMNGGGNVLVTGSEDCTVFVYQIAQSSKYLSLVPIGFVSMPNMVTFLSWKPHAVCIIHAFFVIISHMRPSLCQLFKLQCFIVEGSHEEK
jgi:WD40 repeat protein